MSDCPSDVKPNQAPPQNKTDGEAAPAAQPADFPSENGHALNGHAPHGVAPQANGHSPHSQDTPQTNTRTAESGPLAYKAFIPAAERATAEFGPLLRAVFAPNDLVLIRHVETWTETDSKTGKTRKRNKNYYHATVYRTVTTLASMVEFVALTLSYSARFHTNIFFGVCPRVGKKSYDLAGQIRTVRALWADLDYVTVEEALRKCEGVGLPKPSAVVRSGNGVHLYWLLREPVLIDDAPRPAPAYLDFDNKPPKHYIIDPKTKGKVFDLPDLSPKAKRVQDVVKGIAVKLGGDNTQDLSRLLRLPGTMNRKNQRNGQQPVPCVLVECDAERRYSFAVFEQFAEFAEKTPKPTERRRSGPTRKIPRKGWRAEKFEELLAASANAEVGSRSEPDFSLLTFAIRQKMDPEEVWVRAQNIGKFQEQGRAYFDRTWRNAEAEVAKNGGTQTTGRGGRTASQGGRALSKEGLSSRRSPSTSCANCPLL